MKKKIISTLSLLAILALVFTGCSDDSAPEGFKNVAGENDAFFLYVPTTWISNASGGTASAYYASSDTSNVSMTCMLMASGAMSLEDYYTESVKSLSALLPEFTLVEATKTESDSTDTQADSTTAEPSDSTASPASEGSAEDTAAEDTATGTTTPDGSPAPTETKLGGYDAIRFEYTASLDGKTYHYLQVVTVKNDMFYLVTYTALEENFAAHLADVNAIIGYVTFK